MNSPSGQRRSNSDQLWRAIPTSFPGKSSRDSEVVKLNSGFAPE
jgi:hypothetical protein